MIAQEDEEAFVRRRIQEEEANAARSSCLVRSAHEDLAELYQERGAAAAEETAALRRLCQTKCTSR